jgi:hypothetical protein
MGNCGSRQAWWMDLGAEGLHLELQVRTREGTEKASRFESPKPILSDASPQPCPNSATTGSQVSKVLETMENISLKSPQEPSGNL